MHNHSNHQRTPHGATDPFSTRIRRHLDDSLQALDESTLESLAAARREALEAAARHSPPANQPRFVPGTLDWLLPAGALASVTVVVLILAVLVNSASMGPATGIAGSTGTTMLGDSALDIELLSANETIEVYDNLDFYRWLAAHDRAG